MKTLDVAEVSRLPEELKSGEMIELVANGKIVATVSPVRALQITRGIVPDWFFDEPPPKFPDSAVAKDVRKGETVEVRDGETVVATVVPFREQSIEERVDELARQGKVTKGTGPLPDWFFTEPLPKFEGGSVLEQLLNDRKSRDW